MFILAYAFSQIILDTFPDEPHVDNELILLSFELIRGANGIGMRIRGGSEFGLGIYISEVDRDGPAEICGLVKGDRIHSINDTSTIKVSHDEAVELLTASKTLMLQVERCGTVPEDLLDAGSELGTNVLL